LSIVLLAILAVMWVAFLLPVIAPRQRLGGAWPRRRLGQSSDAGWRPSSGPVARGGARPRVIVSSGRGGSRVSYQPAGRSVLRRRRVLLGLTLAAAASIRVAYVLGGRWWIAEVVAGALLSAYVVALVVQGFRRTHPARPALPAPPRHRALSPPPRRDTALAMPPPQRRAAGGAVPSPAPVAPAPRRRGLRRRRPAEGPLFAAALLEGQGPPTSE
jgi:hypothetical protein